MVKAFLKNNLPSVTLTAARAILNGLDLLRVRKNRSYIHGLLFDLRGKDYESEGMRFIIAPEQFPRSYRSRLYFDIYERPERILVKTWLASNAKVLELGGCIGVLSCVINRHLNDPQQHVVVEANPTLIPILTSNRDSNGCSFEIEHAIISEGTAGEFFIANIMTANRKDSGLGKRLLVPTCTVDALRGKFGVDFDTLILDIEGGEYDFFKENRALLAKTNLIVLELHRKILSAKQIAECQWLLSDAGLSKAAALDETEVWIRS